MKRWMVVVWTVLLTVSLCACGSGGRTSPSPGGETPEISGTDGGTATETPGIPTVPPDTDYSEKTFTVADLAGKYKVQGRTTVISYKMPKATEKTDAIALDYSAASVAFNAFCEGTVSLSLYTALTAIGGNNLYLNVYVDGVLQGSRQDFRLTGTKVHTVAIAENLERGYHTFLIERQTEAERGNLYLNSVTLCGELAEKPADKPLFMEIIGDSITAGYGNLYPDLADGEKDSNPASNVYEDGTRTYAYLAAKALDADYSIVAQQGIGVVSGYYPHTMLKTYTNTCYQCGRRQEWGFERRADIVVINLGTNDHTMVRNGKITEEEAREGFRDFCLLVREKNPDAKIFWAYGMMDTSAGEWVQAALESVGGEEAGFYFVSLTSNGEGGNGHPSAAAHAENAEILVKAIREKLG